MGRFNNGWIKIHRTIVDHPVSQRGLFTFGIFVRILYMANWKESSVIFGGQKVTLQPGQLVTGLRELSPDKDEDPYLNKVRASLDYLVLCEAIEQVSNNQGRLITIRNWNKYQTDDDLGLTISTSEEQAENKQATSKPQLIEESKKERREERKKRESQLSADALPHLAKLWNEFSGSLPKVKGCSSTRRRLAESRWKEKPETEYWSEIITRIAGSKFCRGENQRGWRASFDFLVRPETQHKVLEGIYDDSGALKSNRKGIEEILAEEELSA